MRKLFFSPSESFPWFKTVVGMRSLGLILVTFALHVLMDLGSPPLMIACGGIFGIIAASYGARTQLTWLSSGSLLVALWALYGGLTYLFDFALGGLFSSAFAVESFSLHAEVFLIAFSVMAASTWLFWRVRSAVTLEALAISVVTISIFAGHRDFHFDRPKIINSLAWRLGLNHLSTLMIIGSGLLLFAALYLFFASRALRPQAEKRVVHINALRRQFVVTAIQIVAVVGLGYFVQLLVYRHFNAIMLDRVANGVGMGSESGVSPLSFQSALGSTNQPAALVRLEGDYQNNPFSPMIYLRESALSQFGGRELVFAGRAYDTDLPVITPKDSFTGKEDSELLQRTPVVQSIYLLAAHDNAFALDYPVSIVQLKNPQPNRFKSTYRAYSIGPAFQQADIDNLDVGDPRWTPEVRQHYLVEHADKRYKDLALQITKDITQPVMKVRAITDYLSRTSIYTLTPHHDTKPSDDPVAPFLFGDHRGYCVHFAHAVVYMARAVGIPARIGTGYLTDLSQAKDGHILLRMSDRHAWGEIYVTGVGWIPFDVQPDQVESHADSQVDAKLLEELMGILEPGEEILPPSSTKDEPGMEDPDAVWTPNMALLLPILFGVLALFISSKAVLRLRWKVANDPERRLRWAYIACASSLYDIGISRGVGETRTEFSHRSYHQALDELSSLVVRHAYQPAQSLSRTEVDSAIATAQARLATLPLRKKALGLLNPAATCKWLARGRW
jgi:transglutaminase-like putative cysteine protease